MQQKEMKVLERMELNADNGRILVFEVDEKLSACISVNEGKNTYKFLDIDFIFIINRIIKAFETIDQKYEQHRVEGNEVFEICCYEKFPYYITGRYFKDKLVIYFSETNNNQIAVETIEILENNRLQWLKSLVEFSLKLQYLTDKRRKKQLGKSFTRLFRWIGKLLGRK